jgi:cytochrome c-type biogenesis protein CcmH
MIGFWVMAAALCAGVVAALVRPLLRPAPAARPRADHDRAVYRDQLAELERDLGRGLIGAGEAEAARTEIARRLLAAADQPEPAASMRKRRQPVLALALMVLLPVLTLALYLPLGRPDLPDQPFAGRSQTPAEPPVPAQVLKAVETLAARLSAQPDDLPGWMLLARSLGKLGRFDESVEAWRAALKLAPEEAELRGTLAEALTTAEQGTVGDEARRLFEAVLAQQPGDPRASHYLALARAQAGDFQGALERWQAMVRATPANAPWLPMIQIRIKDMAVRLKLDPAAALPPPLPPAASIDPAQ